jgi:hypothetical protein
MNRTSVYSNAGSVTSFNGFNLSNSHVLGNKSMSYRYFVGLHGVITRCKVTKIYEHVYSKIDTNLQRKGNKKKAATLVVFTVTAELPEAGSGTTKPVILPTLLTVWPH